MEEIRHVWKPTGFSISMVWEFTKKVLKFHHNKHKKGIYAKLEESSLIRCTSKYLQSMVSIQMRQECVWLSASLHL